MSEKIILFMTFTVNWPEIKSAIPIARKYLDQNGGFYYEILDDSGGQTYARIGNPQSQQYVIEFVNVPANRVGLLENWLLDVWNWWMATSTSPANADNLEALYKKASIVIQPKDLLSAHEKGRPLTPAQSATYVTEGKNVFSGNVFERNQRKYEEYLRKHVPGYSKEETIQDIETYVHNLEVMNKEAYANYVSMLNDLIRYLQRGQISPESAKKQALQIYNNALSYKPRGSTTILPAKVVTTTTIVQHHNTDKSDKVVTVTVQSKNEKKTNDNSLDQALKIFTMEQIESELKKKKEYMYLIIGLIVVLVVILAFKVIK